MNKTKDFFRRNEWLLLTAVVVFFILIRLPGTSLPLHQDEYKWPMIVNPAITSDTEIPHPPLSQFIYRTAGHLVGYNVNFRLVPLFFGVLNLLLLYYFLRMRFSRNVANIGVLIFTSKLSAGILEISSPFFSLKIALKKTCCPGR